jgi:hypothetical protein
MLYRRRGDLFDCVAHLGLPPAFAEFVESHPIEPGGGNALYYLIRTKRPSQVLDMRSEQPFAQRDPVTVAVVELGGGRTGLTFLC